MKKEQSISSFHSHLISHKAEQWKEKLVPKSERLRSQPGQQCLQLTGCSTSGHHWNTGNGAWQATMHLESIIEFLHVANRRDPLGFWAIYITSVIKR